MPLTLILNLILTPIRITQVPRPPPIAGVRSPPPSHIARRGSTPSLPAAHCSARLVTPKPPPKPPPRPVTGLAPLCRLLRGSGVLGVEREGSQGGRVESLKVSSQGNPPLPEPPGGGVRALRGLRGLAPAWGWWLEAAARPFSTSSQSASCPPPFPPGAVTVKSASRRPSASISRRGLRGAGKRENLRVGWVHIGEGRGRPRGKRRFARRAAVPRATAEQRRAAW